MKYFKIIFRSCCVFIFFATTLCSQPDTAMIGMQLRKAQAEMDQHHYSVARELCDQLLTELTGQDSFSLSSRINALMLQGWMDSYNSRFVEAESVYHQALDIARANFPQTSTEQAKAYYSLSWINEQSFDMAEWTIYLDSAAMIFSKAFMPDNCWHGRIWAQRARMNYYNFGKPDTTLAYLEKARSIYESCAGRDNKSLFDLHKAYYDAYLSLRKLDSAEFFLRKQIDYVNTQSGTIWDIQRAWLELTQAHLYRLDGHYEKAISHYQYAKTLFESYTNDTVPLLNCGIYSAQCLNRIGKQEEAMSLYFRMHQLALEYTKITWDMTGMLYEGIAHAYASAGKCDTSIYYTQRALNAFYQMIHPDNAKLIPLYLFYSKCLAEENNDETADSILRFVSTAAQKNFGPDHPVSMGINLQHAQIKIKQAEFEEALRIVSGLSQNETLRNYPDLSYQYFIASAGIQIKQQNGSLLNASAKQELIRTLESAMTEFRNIRNQYQYEEARARSVNKSIAGLHDFIPLLYQYYQKDKDPEMYQLMVRISEIHRGLILSEAMNQPEAYAVAGVPKSLQQAERKLKASLFQTQKKLEQEYARAMPKKEYIGKLLSTQIAQQNEFDELIRVFQEKYPDYYQAKFAHNVIRLSDIQKALDPYEVLVEYLVVDNHLYLFVIRSSGVDLFSVEGARSILAEAYRLTRKLSSPDENVDWRNEFEISSHQLYNRLISPFAHLLSASSSLIIIPDQSLHYFPFELLRRENPSDHKSWTAQFLIFQYPVQYQTSILHWLEQSEHKQSPVHNLLAVSPDFDLPRDQLASRSGWMPLVYAEKESNNILTIWGGDRLNGTNATKTNFLRKARRSDVIHMATHAMADDRSGHFSWLAFSPGSRDSLLYIDDIYGMKLNAQMVVLSGCETGIGPLQNGEGLISLSRAFSYAGATSIITSLWPVHDEATSIIMTSFYQHLKNGLSKDRALQQAKIDYLQNLSDPMQADPYYWAGFIAMGDMTPLTTAGRGMKPWIIAGFLILGIIALRIALKKRENVRT